MNNLESGLYLPIRFYQNLSEQDRNKRQSIGVALTELNYVYIDCATLAPFQLLYPDTSAFISANIDVICANSGTIVNIPYNGASWNDKANDFGSNTLTYSGDATLTGLGNGLFYMAVNVVLASETQTLYSDLFMIKNCGETSYTTQDFRIHNQQAGNNFRAIDPTDLRITK